MTIAIGTDGVREIFHSVTGGRPTAGVGDETKIFEEHIIDSLHLVELIEHLESAYGLTVEPEELAPENFESIGAISRYVARKVRQ